MASSGLIVWASRSFVWASVDPAHTNTNEQSNHSLDQRMNVRIVVLLVCAGMPPTAAGR
jgi:hypothetical protein